MNTLQGKVALITGARGGLGSFVTEAFLAAGAKVVGVSRSIQASDFPQPGFAALPAELSSGGVARQVAGDIVAQFGRIDTLVHVVQTDPLQWVQPAQVAALLVHLASDAGAQVTGAAIPIYGSQV